MGTLTSVTLPALVLMCAQSTNPESHVQLVRMAHAHADGHPWAIRNLSTGKLHRPETRDEAVALTTALLRRGSTLRVGLMGLDPNNDLIRPAGVEKMFDSCQAIGMASTLVDETQKLDPPSKYFTHYYAPEDPGHPDAKGFARRALRSSASEIQHTLEDPTLMTRPGPYNTPKRRLMISMSDSEPTSATDAAPLPASATTPISESRRPVTGWHLGGGRSAEGATAEDLEPATPRTRSAKPYFEFARHAAARHGLPVAMVLGVMQVESGFNPAATSRVGAMGLMQVMPHLADGYDLSDPAQNIERGCTMLAGLVKRYDGDIDLVLAGYNAGSGHVSAADGVPWRKTRAYIRHVAAAWMGWAAWLDAHPEVLTPLSP